MCVQMLPLYIYFCCVNVKADFLYVCMYVYKADFECDRHFFFQTTMCDSKLLEYPRMHTHTYISTYMHVLREHICAHGRFLKVIATFFFNPSIYDLKQLGIYTCAHTHICIHTQVYIHIYTLCEHTCVPHV